MKKFYQSFLLLSFTFLIIFQITADAQSIGKLRGKVIDKSTGESLAGVNVIVTQRVNADGSEVNLSQKQGAATDKDGYFNILNVPVGQYAVTASLIGYGSMVVKPIKVDIDRTIEVNFQLEPSSMEVGQVVVVANKEIIKQDVSSTQEVIGTERLQSMPVLRVDEFLGTVKGVEIQSSAQGNGLSFRGGAIRETDVRIDGLSLRDPRSENSYLALNTTTIKEIQVQTGGFTAKYGGVRSGLLNVVTKDGDRDRYHLSLRTDITPAQKRYFGTNPWSDNSWIYRVYADTSANGYAWYGVDPADSTVPAEFRSFKGWSSKTLNTNKELGPLDSLQRLELWKLQHPQYTFANKPNQFYEGTLSGPIPGDFIPFWSEFSSRSTFMAGFKYEKSQLPFPVGPRNDYIDWNGQLKISTQLNDNMRLSVNGLYAKIQSVSGGGFSTYGGALLGESQSFSFLNSTSTSVSRAAGLIGGGSFSQLYNKSRLQFYDGRYFVSGARFVHTLSDKAFYNLDFQMGYTDQDLKPFAMMDTANTNNYAYFYSTKTKKDYRYTLPSYGTPMASTNYIYDPLNTFALTGGAQKVDSSYSYAYQFKGDITAQIGRYHQVEAGFQLSLQDMLVYSGTWYQSSIDVGFSPDTWQYFKATPLEVGLFAQDKLEFQGMILNAGLRVDFFDPMKKGFQAGFPSDEDYKALLNDVYNNLQGASFSWERWQVFRDLLANPPGWPQTENKTQIHVSPRLGVAFPITASSKMYFNYGHFYQRPPAAFLYSTYVVSGGVSIPTPALQMAKTISYEFGFEQMIFNELLLNVTAYYKDIRNEPLSRTYINYYGDNLVTEYVPDAYKDIRGFEIRFERPFGEWFTFTAMYDYMLSSAGQTGFAQIFEDRLKSRNNELRSSYLSETDPLPRANANLNFHSPADLGPEFMGFYPLGDWFVNYFFQWRDGGRFLSNPAEREVAKRIYIDVVDYWNADLKVSKNINTSIGNFELVFMVKNLHNTKLLNVGNMTQTQYDEYKSSLQTPDKGGSDKWGEYDKPYIKTGWYDAPIFLNPRMYILGLRINL